MEEERERRGRGEGRGRGKKRKVGRKEERSHSLMYHYILQDFLVL
jgi:hypothetical protein